MYARIPTEKELAGTGFVPADYETGEFEVWPENMPAINLFSRVGTRWVHGMNGPVGLRYEAIYPLLDRMNFSTQEWDEMLIDIEICEQAALAEMHRKS